MLQFLYQFQCKTDMQRFETMKLLLLGRFIGLKTWGVIWSLIPKKKTLLDD